MFTKSLVVRIRDYEHCNDDDIDSAADTIDLLVKFIRERVADRSSVVNDAYHARRVCMEAEKLIEDLVERGVIEDA